MKKALNILLGVVLAITVVLLIYAVVTPHSMSLADGPDLSISLNIIWGYTLVVIAIAAAIFSAVFGMIQDPKGVKSSLLSVLLMVVIVGAAYFYSAGHTVNITNLQTGSFFDQGPTVLTETSIIVTYVAFVAAVLTSIGTEIYRAFK